jgi:hypothetical protein
MQEPDRRKPGISEQNQDTLRKARPERRRHSCGLTAAIAGSLAQISSLFTNDPDKQLRQRRYARRI